MEELIPLFATPLYIKTLGVELPIEETKLIMETEEYIRVPANNGWRTNNSSLLDKPEYKSLKAIIDYYMEYYV
jgi:hypothetical protein